jgi:hypothetical protein
VRPSDWQFGASIQQEVLPRTSVEVGYHRRWFTGTGATWYTPTTLLMPCFVRFNVTFDF